MKFLFQIRYTLLSFKLYAREKCCGGVAAKETLFKCPINEFRTIFNHTTKECRECDKRQSFFQMQITKESFCVDLKIDEMTQQSILYIF